MAAFRRKLAATRIQRAYRKRFYTNIVRNKRAQQVATSLPKFRVGASKGTFGKKGKKPKPYTGVVVKNNYQTTTNGGQVCYFGMPYAPKNKIVLAYAMNLVQFIAKRSGLVLSSWLAGCKSNNFDAGRMKKIGIRFAKRHTDGTGDSVEDTITPTAADTWEAFAHDIAGNLSDRAKDGWYPESYRLFNEADDVYYDHNRMDEDIVTTYISMYCRIQNVTPADDGTDMNVNAADANPLMGRIYDFKHGAPRLSESFIKDTTLSWGASFGDVDKISSANYDQVILSTMHLRSNSDVNGTLARAFILPPNGASVFSNCEGAKDVSMPPGGFYTVKRTHKVVANVKRFLAGAVDLEDPLTYNPGIQTIHPANVAKSFMVALRPTMRTGTNEEVKLGIARDLVIKTQVKRKAQQNAPAYNSYD